VTKESDSIKNAEFKKQKRGRNLNGFEEQVSENSKIS
jgi:hypothetical protein